MVLLILILVSIGLQLFAAGVAIRLTRVTKFNASWVLITIALVLMCLMRVYEFFRISADRLGWVVSVDLPEWMYGWLGVGTSLCFAVGVLFIRKILNYMSLMEQKRRIYENQILSAVIQAEEKQRQLFSKELHDGLGPLLSSAKMSISALESMEHDQMGREILANTDHMIAMAIKSLREISNNLSPHILDNFGLGRALESFIRHLNPEVGGLNIEFVNSIKGVRFDSKVEVVLYRVSCELINNTIKHAGATLAQISIEQNRGQLMVNYRDNGCGFDASQQQGDGMGLSNITSRISSIKGEILIRSVVGGGMSVEIRI